MVFKRQLTGESGEEGEEGSSFPNLSKRPTPAPFVRDVSRYSVQELVSKLEIPLRNWVRQEVEGAFDSFLRSSHTRIESSSGSRILQLHFVGKLPTILFTGCRVETQDGATLRVELRDARTKRVIRSGPQSSAKVTLRVLDGDFNKEDRDDWSTGEFDSRAVLQREGKRPLMTGTLVLTLKEGVGSVEDVSFTDNSSWTRSGKFRLGATTSDASVIREGISNVFKVKDHRGESYKKHDCPSARDEVWRLKKIAKDGASHRRLSNQGVVDVRDFLRLYVTDPLSLRKTLGSKISEKAWNTIVGHATACLLDENDLYEYKAADGTVLVLNSIFEVDGVITDVGQYLPLDMLDMPQKLLVDNLKKNVYQNLNGVFPIDEHSAMIRQMALQFFQMSAYSNPNPAISAPQNINFPVEQDQFEIQFNSQNAYGLEGSQLKAYAGETSHQIGAVNSMLNDVGLINSNSYDEFPTDGYGWEPPSSLGQLGLTDQIAANENFLVETSPWQANSFFDYPVSSAIGIHISGSGSPRARWCKIRAVIKWQMIKSCCKKNGKASKCTF